MYRVVTGESEEEEVMGEGISLLTCYANGLLTDTVEEDE